MGIIMKKHTLCAFILLCCCIWAFAGETSPDDYPPRYALVIGNNSYTGLAPLSNPKNDANDIAAALAWLGFSVEVVLDGSLDDMEEAVIRLKEKLSVSKDAYGFFFYAGHGVQSGGENFLIPVDANIPGENNLRTRAVSVQAFLDDLNDAGNSLNVVVLDACRDNPFGWNRSTTRGLATVTRQPPNSIIVFATSAGQRASDGEERNGLFTSQLLNNLTTPDLDVNEIFRRTGADVSRVSSNEQIPAIYSQFFGIAYLGEWEANGPQTWAAQPLPYPVPGGEKPGDNARLWSAGASVGSSFADPWLIGTLRGTAAPFRNQFIEAGVDLGFVSKIKDTGFYSVIPFVHYCYFLPLSNIISLYAGAGGSYVFANYDFPEGKVSMNTFAAEITTGITLIDRIVISYTLRTNFSEIASKVSAGYFYRFK